MLETGLEVFLKKDHKNFRKLRLGVLCNQASVDSHLVHISDRVTEPSLKLKITCFMGPQHGIRGEKQDNMVESEDCIDPKTRLPVFSLYGQYREPTKKVLDSLDGFLIDLQDIGTRIYTFMYTMANCMRAAKEHGKRVIVLDRPNPINGVDIEGNVLEPEYSSFVGQYPICVRHGMTMGELAQMFNHAFGIGCDLTVIKMKGWRRTVFGDQWKRDWINPSTNIPNFQSCLVFPGSVLFEGTNVSEGRGTTRPFEMIGAPYIDPDRLTTVMNAEKLPGVFFRAVYFQPMFQKWKDHVCRGVQLHVSDRKKFKPFLTGVRLLAKIAEMYPFEFQWKMPPYEYEHKRLPIDLIAGTAKLREIVDQKRGTRKFEVQAEAELKKFQVVRKSFLLY